MSEYSFCIYCGGKLESAGIHYKCTQCKKPWYRNSKPTAGVLPIKQDQVLLAVRGEEPFKNTLDIIGGFLEPGEHPEAGVKRETLEEIGLEVTIEKMLGIYMDTYPATGDFTQNTFYIGTLAAGEPKIMDDISDLEWIKISDLNKRISEVGFATVAQALKDLQAWFKKK